MPGGPGDCVADREHIAESTGSTSQQWSTNSGTQPLTISCGFPTPYPPNIPWGPGIGAPVDATPLFVVGRRHFPSAQALGRPSV